ncbi:hypothetical protein ACQKGO_37080 [Corallococcus interemptor]|uniref:hypothetical protein n=1 Tax=Corallococcus interemptor TaxID=2316720 RepID=UPI003D031C96
MLYPASIRNVLLEAHVRGLIQAYWSEQVLEEMRRNLVLNDPRKEDSHVVAAALTAGAQVIVTNNLKHFRQEDLPPGMEAQSADAFLQGLLDLDPTALVNILEAQAARMKQPPVTFESFLEQFSRSAPGFIRDVREYLHAVN